MTDPITCSFAAQIEELRTYIEREWAWPSPEAGFARYVFALTGDVSFPLPETPFPSPLNHAPAIAVAGYLLALSAKPSETDSEAWTSGLERLAATDAFPADRQSFPHRPLELLGICLGAAQRSSVRSEDRTWLCEVLRRLQDAEAPQDPWLCLLPGVAAHALGVTWTHACHRPFAEWNADDLALAHWVLEHHGAAATSLPGALDDIEAGLLRRLAVERYPPPDLARAALLYVVLRSTVSRRVESHLRDTWQLTRESRDAVELLSHLCRRFHLFARQLLQRRANRDTLRITDEYDVQDALHALLLLHFEDVRPEEWTPSYAGTSSRMDFLLKRQRVVVETKMTRKGLGQKELVQQLAEDKEYYRAHPDCENLICFIYDPEARCKNPTALEDDVSDDTGKLRTLVIVCPKGI